MLSVFAFLLFLSRVDLKALCTAEEFLLGVQAGEKTLKGTEEPHSQILLAGVHGALPWAAPSVKCKSPDGNKAEELWFKGLSGCTS